MTNRAALVTIDTEARQMPADRVGFSTTAFEKAWAEAVVPGVVLGAVIDKMAESLRQNPDAKKQWSSAP